MNLSNESVNILKNFSTINPSVWVNEGNTLRTVSPAKTIMASAVVDDDFPTPFGIYDLNQFLGTVGLLENPDFDFKDSLVILNIFSSASSKSVLLSIEPSYDFSIRVLLTLISCLTIDCSLTMFA